ncbi:MAG: peptide chain release factor 1, partial [Bacteroidetes bacterium HGW-Bacteroidetes-15]
MSDNTILAKLEGLRRKFEEIGQQITDPSVMSDMKRYISLNKDYRELEPLVEAYDKYKNILSNITSAKSILSIEKDEEMREMAKMEIDSLEEEKEELEQEIKLLLVPADPQDSKNAVLEIRAGTGGDEASIFAGDLYRMYTKYIEKRGWKCDVTHFSEGTVGGYKEVVLNVKGNGVYGILKYESGVHRVQRVPQTETQGRVHTS